METNKELINKNKELKDIVSALLTGWKSKHPEDFEMPEGYTLVNMKSKKGWGRSYGYSKTKPERNK